MNKFLEKIAGRKKLLDIAKSNPFLENIVRLTGKVERSTAKSSIPGLKAMSKQEYSQFTKQIDERARKAKLASKIPPAPTPKPTPSPTPVPGTKDRYAPLNSGAPYFSIKPKRKK